MPTPDRIAELKAAHGEVYEITACDVTVVVKAPTRAQYNQYRTLMFDPDRRALANQGLLLNCVVDPDRAGMEALLERLPGLAETIGSEIAEIAGLTKQVETKKL